ncbi:MAG TPA: sodium-translocating pyrophosphatase [Ignavibacteria bacterium]|nr:sodium-translocating pyrophosphatase [Ignavibacteria bacterium]HAX47836.1 sodium-translocating pyrophosphatase [Bacteroidota bacterium]HRE09526.1 sodium-translocating pyrophosphatase [Ignavibacteria bacterium]HRF64454.1 sodium-translocating pyrophosphatase [Ignavibacteria bacterium]HRJ04930.1 sodium-translocating pyrophosphatase [Ignavibacteria bacterium]
MKKNIILSTLLFLLSSVTAFASEADLKIPELSASQNNLLLIGIAVCAIGLLFGIIQFLKVKKLRAHQSMLDVAQIIYETCKTYLSQQGKFIAILFVIIGVCIGFYFGVLNHTGILGVSLILMWTIIGILGSYGVAKFGIRMNTLANSRMAFASLEKKPIKLLNIPLDAGMSIGVMLICVELIMMLIILLFVPREYAGASFIGFAIGESLGASALRIAGGIFTKIADIGSDLMKIVFKIKEDDPRNPGVIADCTGDNAGDSVGPTADGFETYGVTGVALISFIVLAIPDVMFQTELLTWIFVMRILMIITSIGSFYINGIWAKAKYGKDEDIDFEKPLTSLVWITSIFSIIVTFVISKVMIGHLPDNLWMTLSIIISCGTLGAALIPEFTKIFTSPKSKHVNEVVTASREGGSSLTILSGLVAGNFSAFWTGMVFFILMLIAYFASLSIPGAMIPAYASIFAFGLVAFGMLGMGPVTIAVDSYGPVTDNAQSIYELSLIESKPGISEEIQRDFGFKPDFEKAKHYLEANDGAGNTFKATAKPVLIGTAVVGATTMIFSLILVIKNTLGIQPEAVLSLLNPYSILGFICGGAVIYWFTGASTQAVTTGAYRAVEYIKKNINLDESASMSASTEKSKEVVKICTQYAQTGMFNIFIAIFSFALAFAFFSAPGKTNEPVSFFISFLISIAVFGLFQAMFMANAGGAWDNAKKVVEVDLKEKNTPLHDATVVGDTVGDPFKDTSSVALNPIIKFTTLFGLLAMEMAITESFRATAPYVGLFFFLVAIYFVWRSFYKMRITAKA